MLNWMSTGDYLVVHYGAKAPCILKKGTEKYQSVFALLSQMDVTDEQVVAALDLGSEIQKYSEGNFEIDSNTGSVKIDGQEVDQVITERIVEFYRHKLPYLPLVNFWRNIVKNPSEESKKHLFSFLEVNKMPITHDGCFLAYKKVKIDDNGNLVDCHTSTFCNNVGAVVVMKREDVDPDRNQTCSKGLHVAAYDYAANNYSGTHLLEVKVNPSDVVAVPTDYNNQKMRVCRYEVVAVNKLAEVKDLLIKEPELKAKTKQSKKQLKSDKTKIIKDQMKIKFDKALKTQTGKTVDLSLFSANQIVELVQALTGVPITLSLKNKKSIVKKAMQVLRQAGYLIK